jgi:hypothetical protein
MKLIQRQMDAIASRVAQVVDWIGPRLLGIALVLALLLESLAALNGLPAGIMTAIAVATASLSEIICHVYRMVLRTKVSENTGSNVRREVAESYSAFSI